MKFRTKLLFVMKLTTALILFTALHVCANTAGQTVSYSARNAKLEDVFSALKKQTGYGFFYQVPDLKNAKLVSVDIKNAALTDALTTILKDQNLNFEIDGKTVFITPKKIQASITQGLNLGLGVIDTIRVADVKGKVTDETGKPVIGASVQVKGTNKGTTTNEQGEFNLTGVDEKGTLVISAVNIETREILVGGRKEISLVAKNKVSKLEDVEIAVVNTGYQTIPKERLTGSFSQVDNKTLNLQVGPNILSRLESVTSGISFSKKGGGLPPVTVRGLSTMLGPTAPLVVLDNFPFEGDINSINPNLIESVTLLKDATAASIWGTRAGNGVIVINTKKAKSNQPLSIDFRSSLQVVGKTDLFYNHSISSSDYIDVEQYLFSKGYYNANLVNPNRPPVSPVVDLLDKQARGIISASSAADQIAALRKIDVRDDYKNGLYQNGINQQYSLNFGEGNSQSSWSVNTGYDHNISELHEQYERKSGRFQINFKPVKNLKVDASIYMTGTETKTGVKGYPNQDNIYPYTALWDKDGKPLPVSINNRMAYTDTLGGGRLLDWNYYPAEDYKHNITTNLSNNLIANMGLQYQLGSHFSIDFKYQYESQQVRRNALQDAESFNARYYVNLFSQINYVTGVVTYNVPRGGILTTSYADIKANNVRSQLNYSGKWGKHEVVALAGSEIRSVGSTEQIYNTYGYDAPTATGSITDFKTRFPIITNGSLQTIPSGENSYSENQLRFVSFYGNTSYSYDSKYSITMSARRDASNLFGVNTNQKWAPLWSAGASWNLSKENFYRLAAIPFFKIRATFGYTGNVDPSRSGVVTVFYFSNSSNTGLAGYRIRQFPNPSLRWEQVAISNIGIDYGFRNNRLSGSLEWYQKRGLDLFGTDPVDMTAGIGTSGITKNVANMQGSGIDLVVNSINTTGKLIWTTNFIFNYNTDKVTKAFSTRAPSFYLNDGSPVSALEGQPVHSVMYYKWAGLDNTGNPQGYLNGQVSNNYAAITGSGLTFQDLDYDGPAMPRYFGSITNALRYKGFEININISYRLGYYFGRKGLDYSGLYQGQTKETRDFNLRWQKPGDEAYTDVPGMVYPLPSGINSFYTYSSAMVERGDHLRLQFINLSYAADFGKTNSKEKWSAQFYVNAANLGILWRANKRDIDPDYGAFQIPPSAAYTLGVKLSRK